MVRVQRHCCVWSGKSADDAVACLGSDELLPTVVVVGTARGLAGADAFHPVGSRPLHVHFGALSIVGALFLFRCDADWVVRRQLRGIHC